MAAKTQLILECNKEDAEFVLALTSVFTTRGAMDNYPAALPEALLRIGQWLGMELTGAPLHPIWNQPTLDAMGQFLAVMSAFEKTLEFDYPDWAYRFVEKMGRIIYKNDEATPDEAIYLAVRAVVRQVQVGHYNAAQKAVYFSSGGVPLTFTTWAEQIIDEKVTLEQINQAHFELIDGKRLKILLEDWHEHRGIDNDWF